MTAADKWSICLCRLDSELSRLIHVATVMSELALSHRRSN